MQIQLNSQSLTLAVMFAALAVLLGPAAAQENAEVGDLKPFEEQRTDAYAAQLEAYLGKWLVDDYSRRASRAWSRDYSSVDAFVKSVERNRERWRNVVKPPVLETTGRLQRRGDRLSVGGQGRRTLRAASGPRREGDAHGPGG